MTNLEYKEAINWLYVQTPNYQVEGKKAYKPGLENIIVLCDFFGNPQKNLKMVHVGGTNGKGSTCNMLASVLQNAGYNVGLYTSPHLINFTERIKINGKTATEIFVFDFINQLKQLPENIKPSFFEFTTVMAFEYFKQNNVDIAIIEVGLGGRLDSTNIISPLVSAITNVDLDHQNILGNTIEEIACEKAGIIKPNIPIIIGDDKLEVKNILKTTAKKVGANLIDATHVEYNFESDLKGKYQKKNIKVVLELISELQKNGFTISSENIKNGLNSVQKSTGFIGRWSQISEKPLIICDTAHNFAGMQEVLQQLENINKEKHIVLGFVQDKELSKLLEVLPKEYKYYFVKPYLERGRNPKEYESELKKHQLNYKIFENSFEGYLSAKQSLKENEMLFFGGSNFVVAEILEKVLEK